jgi:hypothetical protein
LKEEDNMTTVSDLVDEIQGRIPADKMQGLFPALNRALKTIAKRLFTLDSDLVIGELDVDLFASVDYTASIAFASGGLEDKDSITDAAAQFVAEGFHADMPIETTCTTNLGPHRITAVSTTTITTDPQESVITTATAASYKITSLTFGYLPSDFWGLYEKPYINGQRKKLEPLPAGDTKLQYTTGLPIYFRIRGNRIYTTPETGSDITINGDYWKNPPTITKMDDYVPYDSLMDDAIQEYLIMSLSVGPYSTDALDKFLRDNVDRIALKRDGRAPVRTSGINWDNLMGRY